jgi:glycosyltransferase involved in cell wall biosynthesis
MAVFESIPTVSVIIPTYNRAHLIGRSIQSVLDQTYRDFEIIVVDDGSTDNTEEIVKRFNDDRIRYIKHDTNRGAGAARNTGIKAARGKYIAFHDSDDECLPEKLEKHIKVFETVPPEVGVVYSDMLQISEDGKTKYLHSPTITGKNIIDPKTSNYQAWGLATGIVISRKDCFDVTGLFDENFQRSEDLELFIRLAKHYSFQHIKEPLLKCNITPGISSNTNAFVIAQNRLIEKYYDEVKNHRRFLAKQYFIVGIALCRDKQIRRGRVYFFKAIRKYPMNIKYLGAALASLLGQNIFRLANLTYRRIRDSLSTGKNPHD